MRDPSITFNEFRECGKALPIQSPHTPAFVLAADNCRMKLDENGQVIYGGRSLPVMTLSEFAALRERHDFRTTEGRSQLAQVIQVKAEFDGNLLLE